MFVVDVQSMAYFVEKRHGTPAGLVAVMVLAATAATTAIAQTAPQGQLAVRALSRDDIAAYGLSATAELSGGLSTVGIGAPVYLEAQLDSSIPASDIVSVTWAISSKPASSTAVLADGPLSKDVPVYEPSDRLVWQVAGRTLLRPDVAGQYTVTATVATAEQRDGDLETDRHRRHLYGLSRPAPPATAAASLRIR